MARRGCTVCTAVLVALVPATLAAQGRNVFPFGALIAEQSRPSFTLIGAGARAAGMGGAFTALADDASAASFNPAGLALLLLPEASVVGRGQRHSEAYRGFELVGPPPSYDTLATYDDTRGGFDDTSLNFAAFTVPLRVFERNLCLQLSYHRLLDFTFDGDHTFLERVEQSPTTRFRQVVRQEGDIHTTAIAAAYQVTPILSLGLNVLRWQGAWTFETTDSATGLVDGRDEYFSYRQDNRLRAWSWNAGALLRYRYHNIGVLYRAPFTADYTFASDFSTNITTDLTSEPRVTKGLAWPASWTFGVAVKPSATWIVTADYSRFRWSRMRILDPWGDGEGSINFFDLQDPTQTRDVDEWRFGTELVLFSGPAVIGLRAGYSREGIPFRLLTGEGSPGHIDGYSLGVGIKRGQFSVDLAYQRRSWVEPIGQFVDPRTVTDDRFELLAWGRKSTVNQRLVLALLYQFPSRDALTRVFRRMFVGPEQKERD